METTYFCDNDECGQEIELPGFCFACSEEDSDWQTQCEVCGELSGSTTAPMCWNCELGAIQADEEWHRMLEESDQVNNLPEMAEADYE